MIKHFKEMPLPGLLLHLRPMPNKRFAGMISMLFVMVVWGSSFAVTKLVVNDIPPFAFAFLRFLIASLVLLPVFILHTKKTAGHPPVNIPWLPVWVMGFSGVTLFYIFFNLSLIYTSAS